ncbi:MAG TPA: tRNA (adenosine(37)-N6)-threonylcarbamoyltransferase complex ATPase subunit type 1 TsaE [Opitutaceae bacterium]|jgi:tRNA threonylcarbamoyladenosine biosynthesis protein TsaE|nr:tRNA (adenosine(37)-N6)-threonylcarbamoyltransferase complex ATPase subunit type 1 TsaE [Opitutaceae bacterium]
MSTSARLRAGVSTGSAAETQALASALAAELPADATLALHGDLGAGKTTFVQGLARGLGIAEPVTSPTFNLYRLYAPAPGGRQLAHFDAYRLDRPAQAEALLLDDFLVSPYCLAIEWPEKIAGWIPAGAWHLELALAGDGRHALRLR